ncbi:4'-phosphopantetheinyl transferase [Aureobasidium melanogenum CBS 110374]|uniref:holo-[acyl-carrier-protein] synthase n=1 Tax=Aureobasidium melanogenum (strain CBS 110374) TaxID=1043003 RepID=A0A074W7G0_AURM1|nr:4'-phosphopantetheinyl transferase [Aureobasidium melanogenum CBS 110374]KEQ67509.1 4'-phosphopantetheinyl transferase [Aureobasidium melanogenum CBS 110374]
MTDSNLQGLTCWLIDTRTLWPGQHIKDAASNILHLLSQDEKETVLRKIFIPDARMSLASALLKRLYISRALNIPWKDVKIARKGDPTHGKPCAALPDGSFAHIDFNVSHQAGLVSLVGWNPPAGNSKTALVGTDIVCVNERDDYRTIDQEGFDAWIDIYEDVFSDAERWDMKYNIDYITLLDGRTIEGNLLGRIDRCVHRNKPLSITLPSGETHSFSSDLLIEAKLRRFYTFFCYKEAYIKLAGEALLAPWLKDLEFQNVKSPKPGTVARCSTYGTWGEKLSDVEVVLHGEKVEDVKMTIQAFEEDFMLAVAVQGLQGLEAPGFTKLDLESDVIAFAT